MKAPYSLWLLPPAGARDHFADLIRALSRRLGTPPFEPHITLAAPRESSQQEAFTRAQAIAAQLGPIGVRLTDVESTDAYFRCLFLRAEKNAPLLAAHRLAAGELNGVYEQEFMPHLSLVYGADVARAEKQNIADEIRGSLPVNFIADRIGLVAIAGTPDRWDLLGALPLTGAAR